ncbi:MAG TPA: TonB family protein [Terriglobales bacterium]|nr:TonB family protein [Terriglobales bacterium]
MPDNLTLGLLPERKRDWRKFAASYGLEIVLILLLLGLRLVFPDQLQFHPREVTELIPPPAPQPEPIKAEAPKPAPAPVPLPTPISPPKLIVPKEVVAQPKKLPEPPKIATEFKPPQFEPPRAVVPKVVYTGSFTNSSPAAVSAPTQKVQTAGFGDPNGLPGSGKENARLTAAALGSFDSMGGGLSGGTSSARVVQSAGFGAQEIAQAKPRQTDNGPPTTPVEILSKPNPVYTEEARQLRLEGEVLLEVMFGANGQLQVNRVVRGLGHGLDEAAVAAASKIQFKPAARNGSPVDSTSIVHVIFQLAY